MLRRSFLSFGSKKSEAAIAASVNAVNSRENLEASGKLVRGFRIDQIATKVAPTDYIYALQSAKNLFTFISRRDATSREIAESILKIEENDRCCHAVLGRTRVPCDFYADIEFPTHKRHVENTKMRQGLSATGGVASGGTPEEKIAAEKQLSEALGRGAKKYTGEEILIDVIKASTALLNERFKYKPSEIIIFDGGATEDKHSYHLHMRAPDVAFAEYSVFSDFFSDVNSAVGLEAIDPGCCRFNGMLRMGLTPKFSEKHRVLKPLRPQNIKDAELKSIIKPMQELSDIDLVACSLVSRLDEARDGKIDSGEFKLIRDAASRSKKKKVYDHNGRIIPPHMMDENKHARFKEICGRVHSLPLHIADDYNTWIRIGLALHSFGPDPAAFQQWVQFSAKVPVKFDPKVCEKYWAIFARRPDCYNWRRGYLYIMKTLSSVTKGQRAPAGSSLKK